MQPMISTIATHYLFISVNSYLVQNGTGFFLVDTGLAQDWPTFARGLEAAGCKPGDLRLMVLTHGDTDHSGNAARLKSLYGAKIAMHPGDRVAVQTGDMFAEKRVSPAAKAIARAFFAVTGMNRFDTFSPDVELEDMQDLSPYGLDARVICLPGHSRGSIGILLADGILFCGDLLENTRHPVVNSLGEDRGLMHASAAKLKDLGIEMVYPGHGLPFPFNELVLNS